MPMEHPGIPGDGTSRYSRGRKTKKWGKMGAPKSAKRRAFLKRIAKKR